MNQLTLDLDVQNENDINYAVDNNKELPKSQKNSKFKKAENGRKSNRNNHSVELKRLVCAYAFSNPCGLCFTITMVLGMISLSGYIFCTPKITMCLNTGFSNFQVEGSKILERHYMNTLITATNMKKVLNENITQEIYDTYTNINTSSTKASSSSSSSSSRSSRRRLLESNATQFSSVEYENRRYSKGELYLFFYDPHGNDVLTSTAMKLAHDIEMEIKEWDGYNDRCLLIENDDDDNDDTYSISPPDSFLNNLFPTNSSVKYILNDTHSNKNKSNNVLLVRGPTEITLSYDGNGNQLCCNVKQTAIDLVLKNNEYYDFFDNTFSLQSINISSKFLLTIFKFGYSLNDKNKQDIYKFLSTYDNLLSKYLPESNDDKQISKKKDIGIAYTDSAGLILSNQLMNHVIEDLELALISFVIVYIVVYLYVRSLFLTTFGLLGVLLSFIPSLMLYNQFYGDVFNVVNCTTIWIILGIGSDDIFVFMASYRRSPLITVDGRPVPDLYRMSFAYKEAGSAMFFTSFTTACSFASLMFSKITVLQEFGFFSMILVLVNYVMIMTWFPCLLQLYVWWIKGLIKCGIFKIFYCEKIKTFVSVPIAVSTKQYSVQMDENGISVKTVVEKGKNDGKCVVFKSNAANISFSVCFLHTYIFHLKLHWTQ